MSKAITIEKVRTFAPMFGAWFKRGWIWLAALVGALLLVQSFVTFGVNASKSLGQYTLFMVLKWDKDIQKGDLMAFEYTGTNPYDKGLTWVKRASGVAGDTVTKNGRSFFVNGVPMGEAKPTGKRGVLAGKPLELGPTGVIPSGHFYVQGDHEESLDSRYELMGWVPTERIKGRAVVIF